MPDLQQILKETKEISPAPQILPKLHKLLDDPNSELDDAVNLIKMDVGLSGSVLKYANSSLFGAGLKVETLDMAVQRFGFRQVQKLVMVATGKSALNVDLKHYNHSDYSLFEISLACAELMREMAKTDRLMDPDLAFTIGLFHGIGKLVIEGYFSRHEIVFFEGSNNLITLQQERKLLGFDHAEAGAALLKNWKFADSIVGPIRHQFSILPESDSQRAVVLSLTLAAVLAKRLPEDPFEPEELVASFAESFPELWAAMDVAEEKIEGILERARASYEISMDSIR
ncbi:MAG: HDOD domain-containing protein [Opitutales bacterium]